MCLRPKIKTNGSFANPKNPRGCALAGFDVLEPLGELLTLLETGKRYDSLRAAKMVSERFAQFDRRRSNLSFKHHVEVAFLEPEIADTLLDDAERDGLTQYEAKVDPQFGGCSTPRARAS